MRIQTGLWSELKARAEDAKQDPTGLSWPGREERDASGVFLLVVLRALWCSDGTSLRVLKILCHTQRRSTSNARVINNHP